jgi:hypothetical protein
VPNVTIWRALAVLHEGQKLFGSYAYIAEQQLVQVRTPTGERSAKLNGSTPDAVARTVLVEMAKEGNA